MGPNSHGDRHSEGCVLANSMTHARPLASFGNLPTMVSIGVIGLGNMGSEHAKIIPELKGATLGGVADEDQGRLDRCAADAPKFIDPIEMMDSGKVDAVVIATPHFSHTTLGMAALQRCLHVMTEKPISVHKADAQRLISAWNPEKQVFAAMFNQRTDPYYQEIRNLVLGGGLGELVRVNWLITNWFRTDAYYASGGWRATWAGEGGGVLLNQCPHNLDLLQWICGMPSRVAAFAGFGKRHDIEVEDEVTAYFEYENGATGVFVTSTGEAPGTNRLEIAGDLGKLVYEGDKIVVTTNESSASEFCRTAEGGFSSPKTSMREIKPESHGGQHRQMLQDFVDAIIEGRQPIAPGQEGINSIELANAMLLSAWTGKTIQLPLDAEQYEIALNDKIAESQAKKDIRPSVAENMSGSFR
jgi:predicted dehydrogenase